MMQGIQNEKTNEQKVHEYRAKHKRCRFCKNHKTAPCGSLICTAKNRIVWNILPRWFCSMYDPRQ